MDVSRFFPAASAMSLLVHSHRRAPLQLGNARLHRQKLCHRHILRSRLSREEADQLPDPQPRASASSP